MTTCRLPVPSNVASIFQTAFLFALKDSIFRDVLCLQLTTRPIYTILPYSNEIETKSLEGNKEKSVNDFSEILHKLGLTPTLQHQARCKTTYIIYSFVSLQLKVQCPNSTLGWLPPAFYFKKSSFFTLNTLTT